MKKKKKVLITGSSGLVGGEAVKFFCERGFEVHGVDNNMRAFFFGPDGDTRSNKRSLIKLYDDFHHHEIDIRENKKITDLFKHLRFDLIIHTAAQPSHDWAATNPLVDFSVNATATMQLLENTRNLAKDAVFIFTSTNKLYGDRPNLLPLREYPSRYDLPLSHPFYKGIDENMSVDQSMRSIFGVSKTSADFMIQEYGRYFGLKTAVFRCGCLTGSHHSGARLHGFLSYLVKCAKENKEYTIIGYKGKQVRDNIHAYDLVNAFYEFYKRPKKGEVYNMGGSRYSNISVLEAIEKVQGILGKKLKVKYHKAPRKGDHIWYISNVEKFKRHYPKWKYSYTIDRIFHELCGKTGSQ